MSNNDKLVNLKNFCESVTKEEDYIDKTFYEFFEIPEKFRDHATSKARGTDFSMNEDLLNDSISESSNKNNSPLSPMIKASWREFQHDDLSRYCCYFIVSLKSIEKVNDYQEFTFHFQSLINEADSFTLKKRYSEFTQFMVKLKTMCKGRPPNLPNKRFLHDKDRMGKRGKDLNDWLTVVSNEKLFYCSSLFEFLKIEPKMASDYQAIDPLGFVSSSIDVNLNTVGYEKVQGSEQSDFFYLFTIKITIVSKSLKDIISVYEVKRRFREFALLHNILKRKFRYYNQNLPELPSKVLIFGKVDADTRQYKLSNYLKLLKEYPDIFEVIDFRRFLQLELYKFKEFSISLEGRSNLKKRRELKKKKKAMNKPEERTMSSGGSQEA